MRSDAELLAPKLGQPPEKHAQRRSLSARLFYEKSLGFQRRSGAARGCRVLRSGVTTVQGFCVQVEGLGVYVSDFAF